MIHVKHLSLQQVYFFKEKTHKGMKNHYWENSYVQFKMSLCNWSLMGSCLCFVFCFWHFEFPYSIAGGGEEKSSWCLYIFGFPQTVVTTLFRHRSRFEVFFWDQGLLFPLTKKFCLKGKKSIMCLIGLQRIFSLAPKKAVSLLCVQCNDSMKCSTLNALLFQWIETLFLEVIF